MKKISKERKIGYNISRQMEACGMSVEFLASALNWSEMHLKAILTGSCNISDEELQSIADKLGVTPKLLVKRDDSGIENYNIHYMGEASDPVAVSKVLDEIDMYVRLLNRDSDD